MIKQNIDYHENFEQFYVDWKLLENKFFQNETNAKKQEVWKLLGEKEM